MPGINWLLNLQAKYESLANANRTVERMTQSINAGEKAASDLEKSWNRLARSAIDSTMQSMDAHRANLDALGAAAEKAGYMFDLAGRSITNLPTKFEDAINAGFLVAQENQSVAQSEERVAKTEQKRASILQRLGGVLRNTAKANNAYYQSQKEAAEGTERGISAMSRFAGTVSQVRNPLDGVTKKLTRMALSFFTVRKLVRYLINAVARAPDEIGSSLTAMKTEISDGFARVTVSALAGMQKSLDRLKKALDSPGGQRLLRGLETAARLTGEAVGWVIDKVALAVEWLGDHFQQAATVAALALTVFGGQALFAAAATLAANWPVLLLVAGLGLLVSALGQTGVTAEQIFKSIGEGAGWLYATVYNLVADAWNLIAGFAEFFANVFNDPLSAVAHLFVTVFDTIVGVVETAAKAIDALTGSHLAAAVSGFRNNLQAWADATFGAQKITFARMDKIDNRTVMDSWGTKAEGIAVSFSGISLDAQTPQAIKGIKSDTGAIRKSVSMAEEDLKSLVDTAERRFVAQFNLQHMTPQITVNNNGTGNTTADAAAIAESVKRVLLEQTASGAYYATGIV